MLARRGCLAVAPDRALAAGRQVVRLASLVPVSAGCGSPRLRADAPAFVPSCLVDVDVAVVSDGAGVPVAAETAVQSRGSNPQGAPSLRASALDFFPGNPLVPVVGSFFVEVVVGYDFFVFCCSCF